MPNSTTNKSTDHFYSEDEEMIKSEYSENSDNSDNSENSES